MKEKINSVNFIKMKAMKNIYKRFAKGALLFILILHVSLSSFAATYYVSSTGSDSNTGLTTALAWKTLAKVNAASFVAGDQILFKRGDTFYGSLIIKNSGASGKPITYGAYGTGANPILTGFTTVTAWTNLGGNIWESTSAVSTLSTCNMVAINGVNTAMGRWPNAATANSGYAVIATNPSTTSLTSASLTGTPNWKGAELVLRLSYLIKRKTITSQVGNLLNYTTANGAPAGGGFFIQNHPSTLDQQNEWYFNPTTKKIQVYSTSQPTNVKVSSVGMVIDINGTAMSYIDIDGLTLEGSNGVSIGRTGPTVGNYINTRNCTIRFTGVNGIQTNSHYATLENNTISDSQVSSIVVSSHQHVVLRGNTLTNTGMLRGMGDAYMGTDSGISATNAHYLLCENNNVINSGYKGISFYGNYITIKNNFVDTYGVWHDDGGGIYTYTGAGTPMVDCKINGNIVINGMFPKDGTSNSSFPIMACGIYCDFGTQNVEILNNSIYKASSYAMMMGNNQNMNIHNNTFFDDFDLGSTTTNALVRINNVEDAIPKGYNIAVNSNILVSPSPAVVGIYAISTVNNIQLIGTWDNNCYASISTLKTPFKISQPNQYGNIDKTLSQWQAFSGDDTNSHFASQEITSANDLQFEYNASKATKTIPLSRPMIDMKGTKYATSVTLQPYTSVVLMKDANPVQVVVPVLVGSTVENSTPKVLEMNYDISLANIIPAIASFSVKVNSVARTVNSVAVSGKKVLLTLASPVFSGDIVTVSYNKPSTNPIQSTSAGQAVSISNQKVINNVAILKQGSIATHYVPVWEGENGINHMNIIVISATLEDNPLSADDEIGVFCGSNCVGSIKLNKSINPSDDATYLTIPVSQSDGTNNGFIPNDTIIFKIWDNTSQAEVLVKTATYKNDISNWSTTGKYAPGSTSVVEIKTFVEYTQTISLIKGYNLISTYLAAENADASVVTKSLKEEGSLVKLQDEAGNSFENWGSYGGWINKLGIIENTEGYKILVANNCTLQVTGRSIALPLDISLKSGWNIISFPRTDMVDAMAIVQPLIDQNKLIKVQDEAGNSIEDWGIFGGWKNEIGNFVPGKAYKVKLNADAVLTIQENYTKSAVMLAQAEQPEYFSTTAEGNGTDHININVVGLREAGLSVGDELAAFDGTTIVGSLKITEKNMVDGTISITAPFSTDGQNPDGFKEGGPIKLFAWNKLANKESEIQAEVLKGNYLYSKNSSVLVRIKSATTDIANIENSVTVDVFPNPTSGRVTVRFSTLPENGSRIDILDISGRKVASRFITATAEEFNLDGLTSGLYVVKTVLGSTEAIHKLIVNK